jgi:hypothetical protein
LDDRIVTQGMNARQPITEAVWEWSLLGGDDLEGLRYGMIGSSPSRLSNYKGRFDPVLREARGLAAAFLDRPSH